MRGVILGLLCAALVGCGAPVPPATSPASATGTVAPSPAVTPSPTIASTCYQDPVPSPPVHNPLWLPSSYCPAEEVAVQSAVAHVGYPVQRIDILPNGGCGPFLTGPVACFVALTGAAVYVTFSGTDQVAVLTLELVPFGPLVAHLETFRIPPAGWSLP